MLDAAKGMLTWAFVDELEADLMGAHDAIGVMLGIELVHCETISVLDGAVIEGEAEHPTKLHCLDRQHNLRYHYRF